jgi:site-specific recombinase XerD
MGVYEKQKGSGEWWCRYSDAEGNIHREKAGTITRAKKLYEKRKADVWMNKKLPHLIKRKATTFAELAAAALEYSKANKRSWKDDEERLGLLEEWFGKLPAENVTSPAVEKKLLEAAKDRGWKPATPNRYRATLSLAYKLGIKAGTVTSNPAKGVTHQREDNQVVRWLTDDEEKRLKAAIKKPERLAALLFSLNTGMRAGEQWGLTWDRINLQTKLATLPTTKNGTMRHVPLNQYALDALRTMKDRPQPNGRVFHQQQHRVWFERALKAAKITDYHWHCNRHSTATRLVRAGVPLHTVAAILGHKGLDMVLRYAHFAPDYLAGALDKLVA